MNFFVIYVFVSVYYIITLLYLHIKIHQAAFSLISLISLSSLNVCACTVRAACLDTHNHWISCPRKHFNTEMLLEQVKCSLMTLWPLLMKGKQRKASLVYFHKHIFLWNTHRHKSACESLYRDLFFCSSILSLSSQRIGVYSSNNTALFSSCDCKISVVERFSEPCFLGRFCL